MAVLTMSVDRGRRINGEYKVLNRIDSGAFGAVYRVQASNGTIRAAKFVKKRDRRELETESTVIPRASSERQYGAVYQYFHGRHGNHHVLVMDLLGSSLWDLNKKYGRLSTKSVLMLGSQMIQRVRELHERGFIHRDIKPDNFMVGRRAPDNRYVYLIDFGFAQRFREGQRHRSKTAGHSFLGTRSFASRHSHRGERQSRRSDLESVVYSLVYMFKGKLPWKDKSMSQAKKIKESIKTKELCVGCPEELRKCYRYVRDLGYSQKPDYDMLCRVLEGGVYRLGYSLDYRFEWT